MALTLPKQDTPIEDPERPGLFGKVWWLFLWSIVQYLQSASSLTIDQTLVAASTTITRPKGDALKVTYILRQDATGGRPIVWDAAWFSGVSAAIDTTASTISTFQFAFAGGKYVMVGQPTTGMTP